MQITVCNKDIEGGIINSPHSLITAANGLMMKTKYFLKSTIGWEINGPKLQDIFPAALTTVSRITFIRHLGGECEKSTYTFMKPGGREFLSNNSSPMFLPKY